MEIINDFDSPYNFEPHLQPLFDAMKAGKKIKKIVCMGGTMNNDNPEKDFEIRNFVALSYWVSSGGNSIREVDIVRYKKRVKGKDLEDMFYMNWVRSFEL